MSLEAPVARERRPYIAWHFVLTGNDVDRNVSDGRRFLTSRGEPLETKAAIREAFQRDGEVVSR